MKLKAKKTYIAGFIILLVIAGSLAIMKINKNSDRIKPEYSGALNKKDDHGKEENDHHDDEDNHKEKEESGHDDEEDSVKLEEKELKEFGIEIEEAGPGILNRYISLTGEIVVIPDRLAHIVPRFPGIVKSVRKKIGDRVYRGEILAVIESNESLVSYNLTSLISGTVINMHISRGEVISDINSGHGFDIADLRYVWVNLNVYQKDLQNIFRGQKVIIYGPGSLKTTGKISYISPDVNEKTRTATARIVLYNRKGQWRPGIFVNAKAITKTVKVPVHVKKTALFNFNNKTVVFVKTDHGFKPRPVTAGTSDDISAEIKDGLSAGEKYAAKGGFIIKAELMKESFGGGHSH